MILRLHSNGRLWVNGENITGASYLDQDDIDTVQGGKLALLGSESLAESKLC